MLGRPAHTPRAPFAQIAQQHPSYCPMPVLEKTPHDSVEDATEPDLAQPLISLVSNRSGLERREVVRRAQRKRRALGPITLVMALALLAREQGLDMHEVTELTGPSFHSQS